MNVVKILEKIAYCYSEKFKEMGRNPDPLRDWHYAEKALNHLLLAKDEHSEWWKRHEEDYGEFRKFLDDVE